MKIKFRRRYFVARKAICESQSIGKGSKIWNFSHVLAGAIIGEDCNICENVFVENDVRIGNRVTVKNGVQLWDGIEIHDDVFIGPNVTFTNDRIPKSKNQEFHLERTVVEKGASIGANATILPGLIIGEYSLVGAGAVVTKNIAAYTVVVGNPAKAIRNIDQIN